MFQVWGLKLVILGQELFRQSHRSGMGESALGDDAGNEVVAVDLACEEVLTQLHHQRRREPAVLYLC